MLTDVPPRKANRAGFLEGDRIKTLALPQDGRVLTITKSVELAMNAGTSADVRGACAEFLGAALDFYKVPTCGIRVLAASEIHLFWILREGIP